MVSPTHKAGEVIPPEPFSLLGGSCSECLPGINQWTMPMQARGRRRSGPLLRPALRRRARLGGQRLRLRARGGRLGRAEPQRADDERALGGLLGRPRPRGALAGQPAALPAAPTRGGHAFADLYLRDASGALTPLITAEPPHRDAGSLNPNRLIVRFAAANAGPAGAFEHLAFEANDALTGAGGGHRAGGAGSERRRTAMLAGQLQPLRVVGRAASPRQRAARQRGGGGRGGDRLRAPAQRDPLRLRIGQRRQRGLRGRRARSSGARKKPATSTPAPAARRPSRCKGRRAAKKANRSPRGPASSPPPRTARGCCSATARSTRCDEGAEAYLPAADLTEDEGGLHQGGFQGILGANPALSRVYFVDTAALSGENAEHRSPQPGEDNLYLWEAGTTSFIGTLLAGDNGFSVQRRLGAWKANPATRTAQTSADGALPGLHEQGAADRL